MFALDTKWFTAVAVPSDSFKNVWLAMSKFRKQRSINPPPIRGVVVQHLFQLSTKLADCALEDLGIVERPRDHDRTLDGENGERRSRLLSVTALPSESCWQSL